MSVEHQIAYNTLPEQAYWGERMAVQRDVLICAAIAGCKLLLSQSTHTPHVLLVALALPTLYEDKAWYLNTAVYIKLWMSDFPLNSSQIQSTFHKILN